MKLAALLLVVTALAVGISVSALSVSCGPFNFSHDIVGGGIMALQAAGEACSAQKQGPAEWHLLTPYDKLVRARWRRAGSMLTY